jgi:hypothetical protein
MHRAAVVLILLAFGFGLLAGPHPCSVRHDEARKDHSPSCHAAMHGSMKGERHSAAHSGRLSRGRGSCCDEFCQHACQTTAIVMAEPVTFAVALVTEMVVEVPGSALPLLTQTIDHIPLS